MPRARHSSNVRQSRQQGIISGTTFVTYPSGVTIDRQGVDIDGDLLSRTELGYLDGLTAYPLGSGSTAAIKFTHGQVDSVSWSSGSSSTLRFSTGLTLLG